MYVAYWISFYSNQAYIDLTNNPDFGMVHSSECVWMVPGTVEDDQ